MASAVVFTHRYPAVVGDGADRLVSSAAEHGLELRAAPGEVDKHPAFAEADARTHELGWPNALEKADWAIVLGGDGSLLRTLHQVRGGPPAFGVNYGVLGYLSAVPATDIDVGVRRLVSGDVDIVELPALEARFAHGNVFALNDVVVRGDATGRINKLTWRIVSRTAGGEECVDEMGVVPCDGIALSTPLGSTAYNLSNGGPVVAWGAGAYAVSFVAPHTLAARPLVVGPQDQVELENVGRGAPLRVFADGVDGGLIHPGESLRVGLGGNGARLATLGQPTFYARYRDAFTHRAQEPGRAHAVATAAPVRDLRLASVEGDDS